MKLLTDKISKIYPIKNMRPHARANGTNRYNDMGKHDRGVDPFPQKGAGGTLRALSPAVFPSSRYRYRDRYRYRPVLDWLAQMSYCKK